MNNEAQFYEIIVDGQLDPGWSAWFDGMIITWRDVAAGATTVRRTVFSGFVPDQAALYGMLNKLADLGLGLVCVTRCTPPQRMLKAADHISTAQIALVQQSFGQASRHEAGIAALFYTRLFELDPSLRPLFSRERAEQERKFTAMLVTVVCRLPHPFLYLPVVQGLGRRHAAYGVREEHYAVVEAALLWALAQALGEGFTPAVEIAWRTAYRLLAKLMKEEGDSL
jgi:hemoglobin-like flavoprotein